MESSLSLGCGHGRPEEQAITKNAVQAAGVDQHGLVRDAPRHRRGGAAGVQKQSGIRPQQRQRFFGNDLLCFGIAGRAAAEQVIGVDHLLHRFDSAMHPHHPARFVQCPEVGAAADPDALRQRFRCDPALRQEKKFSYFCHDRLVTKASALLSCIPAHR